MDPRHRPLKILGSSLHSFLPSKIFLGQLSTTNSIREGLSSIFTSSYVVDRFITTLLIPFL